MLQASLINSFCVTDIRGAAKRYWPENIKYVEVYAFMQSDLMHFLGHFPGIVAKCLQRNAVNTMARCCGDTDVVLRAAEKMHATFSGKQIVAFATFFPEIMAHRNNEKAALDACKSLEFLMAVARQLQAMGHPIKTIEIVGGSRVDGVWRGRRRDNHKSEIYMVNQLSLKEAIVRLLSRLTKLAIVAAKEPKIDLALELEPGPLFVINSKTSLEILIEHLAMRKNAAIAEVLGLNLDIPHWAFLSDVSLDWVENPANGIRNRIIHAHISDHAKGHFSDNAIFSHNKADKFLPWIRLLRNVQAENPRFSGFVSCELEACRQEAVLNDSVKNLIELLKTP